MLQGYAPGMTKHKWDLICSPPRRLVGPIPLDPRGKSGPTPGQARGPNWRQTSRGFYVPADTPVDVPEQRILEQAMRLPTTGAVTGWAACRLYGGNFFDGLARDGRTLLPVPLAVGPCGNPSRDTLIHVSFDRLPAAEVRLVQGIPTVGRERAVFDAMRFATDVREAAVALAMAVGARISSLERVSAYVATRAGATGVAQVREALPLAGEHSRSPNEVRLGLMVHLDAGLPLPSANCPIHDLRGRLLGIADLLDLEAGLVVEFDGAEHRGRRRHTKDVAKDEAFRGCGLEVTRVTGTDLNDTALVVRRVLTARRRAAFDPPDRRRWEARPPRDTVERELREREQMSEILAEVLRQPQALPPTG